jgi:hypothetical protein
VSYAPPVFRPHAALSGETLYPTPFAASGPDYAPYAADILPLVTDDARRDQMIEKMLLPTTRAAFGVSRHGIYGAMQAPSGGSGLGWFLFGLAAGGAIVGGVWVASELARQPQPEGQ